MSRLPLAFCMSMVLACTSQDASDDGNAPRLLETRFAYDATAMPGFTPKPATWNGDTLTLYDYWALTDQPVLSGRAEWSDGELDLVYESVSAASNDWSPSVETRLSILVPAGPGQVKLRFLAMPKARKPSEAEAAVGVQDATQDRVLALPRP